MITSHTTDMRTITDSPLQYINDNVKSPIWYDAPASGNSLHIDDDISVKSPHRNKDIVQLPKKSDQSSNEICHESKTEICNWVPTGSCPQTQVGDLAMPNKEECVESEIGGCELSQIDYCNQQSLGNGQHHKSECNQLVSRNSFSTTIQSNHEGIYIYFYVQFYQNILKKIPCCNNRSFLQ